MRSLLVSRCLTAAAVLLLPAWVSAEPGLSHVRVVRLSYVSGTVGVQKPGATTLTKAIVNTPIQEGFEIETSANSYAEVEFENGSTVRLGQLTRAGFTQLAMDADGNKLNKLTIDQGYATFHFLPEHRDSYSVAVANAVLNPSGKAEFRTDFEGGQARVEVMSGSVQIEGGGKSERLGKDQVLQLTPGSGLMASNVQHGITKDDWDKWAEERDKQHELAFRDQAVPGPGGAMYGWSDLDFYGEWAMIPGFGYGWAPYVATGWSPFTMGMWDMYPGMGLTWISSEPWGWLPYHYGLWNFAPSFGWFWMPGSFNSWSPALVNWYGGPGWTGWAPRGVITNPGTGLPITAVSGNTLRTGQMLTAADVQRESPSAGTLLKAQPAFTAAAQPGLASFRNMAVSSRGFARTAPAAILMGGDPAAERALLNKRPGALGRAFGASNNQPMRVRGGTTLGGAFAVKGSAGEFRGGTFRPAQGGREVTGGPTISDRSHSSYSHATVLAHGQSSMAGTGSGSGGMHSGGAPSGMSTSSPSVSSSSMSSASHSSSSSSSGGHH